MDQNQQEPTFEESIKEVMRTLPPPIRQYLAQGKYTLVAKNLMSKYGLRIDQGGVLEREIMLLLMGIENPDEFSVSLKSDAALSEDTVRSIMNDINQEIFIPLQREMQSTGNAVSEAKSVPPAPELQQGSLPAPKVSASVPSYPPLSTQRSPVSSDTAPLPPKMAMPGAPIISALPPRPFGEEQRARLVNLAPRPVAPLPTNLPGAFPPRPATEIKSTAVAPAVERPAPPPVALRPATPMRPYSTDPYRESLDEPQAE
ncbi:MAG: hypothetical protein KGJ31_02540 [Patescibacteria group bacterium]|nr:hypothetical protein [Patescibacteria group bacterium]